MASLQNLQFIICTILYKLHLPDRIHRDNRKTHLLNCCTVCRTVLTDQARNRKEILTKMCTLSNVLDYHKYIVPKYLTYCERLNRGEKEWAAWEVRGFWSTVLLSRCRLWASVENLDATNISLRLDILKDWCKGFCSNK